MSGITRINPLLRPTSPVKQGIKSGERIVRNRPSNSDDHEVSGAGLDDDVLFHNSNSKEALHGETADIVRSGDGFVISDDRMFTVVTAGTSAASVPESDGENPAIIEIKSRPLLVKLISIMTDASAVRATLKKAEDAFLQMTGLSPVRHEIDLPNGLFPAIFYEIRPFIEGLNRLDRQHFLTTAAGTPPQADGRSSFFSLLRPLTVEGREIRGIRLKGIAPAVNAKEKQTGENQEVPPYTEGAGVVPHPFRIDHAKPCSIFCGEPIFSARGTMPQTELVTEISAAMILGGGITDTLLGFGFYPTLSFEGRPVGFAVYGMEREKDRRIGEYYGYAPVSNSQETGSGIFRPLIVDAAGRLRAGHQRGFWFSYPHMGNFGVNSGHETRLLDLENANPIPGNLTSGAAALYIDISRILYDLLELKTLPAPVPPLAIVSAMEFLGAYFGADFIDGFQKAVDRKNSVKDNLISLLAPLKLAATIRGKDVDLAIFRSVPILDFLLHHLSQHLGSPLKVNSK